MKPIPIKINEESFYDYYLRLLNSISSNRVSGRELDVLAEYMKKYNSLLNLPAEERVFTINSPATRKEIREKLGIKEQNMNNILSSLKKKGHLVNGRMKWFNAYREVDEMTFKFLK